MLKHSDLFTDLPQKFYDSAFLDRIHFYIPGWEMDIIITFDHLFGPYLQNVNQLTVIEPHLNTSTQLDHFLELLETVIKFKSTDEEILVHLITVEDEFQQETLDNLTQ